MSIALIHIGSKYLTLELTEYQKEMLKHPLSQIIILVAILYTSTKDIKKTLLLVTTIYIFIYVIFNENYKNNKLNNIKKNKKSKIVSKIKSLFN